MTAGDARPARTHRARAGAVSDVVVPAQPHLDRHRDVHGARPPPRPASIAASAWHIRAEPPPVLTTLLTGQPMLMSTTDAPWSTTQRRGLAHLGDDVAVDLDRQRPVLGAGLGQLERPRAVLQDRAGVDQVGRRQAEPAAARAPPAGTPGSCSRPAAPGRTATGSAAGPGRAARGRSAEAADRANRLVSTQSIQLGETVHNCTTNSATVWPATPAFTKSKSGRPRNDCRRQLRGAEPTICAI